MRVIGRRPTQALCCLEWVTLAQTQLRRCWATLESVFIPYELRFDGANMWVVKNASNNISKLRKPARLSVLRKCFEYRQGRLRNEKNLYSSCNRHLVGAVDSNRPGASTHVATDSVFRRANHHCSKHAGTDAYAAGSERRCSTRGTLLRKPDAGCRCQRGHHL